MGPSSRVARTLVVLYAALTAVVTAGAAWAEESTSMSDTGSTDDRLMFYCPPDWRCGDFIPFYWDGEYHLFHIRDRDWRHIGTRDLVSYTYYGTAIAGGGPEVQDACIYTGCVVEKDGLFHIFYTGHNAEHEKLGLPFTQVTMHATSTDLINWEKDPDWRIEPDVDRYSPAAWRDPHVFWNEAAGEYWMVVTAAVKGGPPRRSGCTALCTSKDLLNWEIQDPIWSPYLFDSHECPDLFQMGDWWYLVFSTYSTQWITHYRMARSPEGPWIAPPDDQFDGRTFYAAKTASDGDRRLIIGWVSIRADEKDEGKYLWGGSLQFHELVQQPDGTLGVRLAPEVAEQFADSLPLSPTPVMGTWTVDDTGVSSDSPERFSYLKLAEMPDPCLVETNATFAAGTESFGLMLRVSAPNLDAWYQVRLEPGKQRVVFDRSNRYFHDHTFVEERPVKLTPGEPVSLKVLVSGSVYAVYVNDTVALTARGYDLTGGAVGVFASEGSARFSGSRVRTMQVGAP